MFKSIAIISMLAASINAAPTPVESAKLVPRVDYIQFNGDGSTAQGWPSTDDWHTWDDLWSLNSGIMAQSCGFNNWGPNDSSDEIEFVRQAIQNVAGQYGLDDRFVLAVVMEESQGCVRVPATRSPGSNIFNPGLMQSHSGAGNCQNTTPCPQSQINQMIIDGVHGTAAGDGLQQTVASVNEDNAPGGAQKYYAGARKYNSGTVDPSNLGNGFGANNQYSSDIANRLLGWHN